MGFLNQAQYEDIGEGLYRLCKPLVYIDKNDDIYVVEKGFITDLATIPKRLHFILPPDGDYEESAILHDWMLKNGYSRSRSSSIFFESMISDNIVLHEAVILYLGTKSLDLYKSLLRKVNVTKVWWGRVWQ